jgi:hypothetical protein
MADALNATTGFIVVDLDKVLTQTPKFDVQSPMPSRKSFTGVPLAPFDSLRRLTSPQVVVSTWQAKPISRDFLSL